MALMAVMAVMAKKSGKSGTIPFVALFLAWLIPGAGHVYLGRVGRGTILFVMIGATFWAGMAMGGVMTVDYHNERWWFAAAMLTGIHGLVGWHRQGEVYKELADDPTIGLAPRPGTPQRKTWNERVDQRLAAEGKALVYPTDTVARAYVGVAGLLNLLCVFDAVLLSLLGVTGEAGKKESPPAGPTERRESP